MIPVSVTLTGTAGPDGTAEAVYTVPHGQSWTIERMAATGASSIPGELRVYLNGTMVDSTGYPINDTSESNGIGAPGGSQLRAAWSKLTAGAAMRLTIEGVST